MFQDMSFSKLNLQTINRTCYVQIVEGIYLNIKLITKINNQQNQISIKIINYLDLSSIMMRIYYYFFNNIVEYLITKTKQFRLKLLEYYLLPYSQLSRNYIVFCKRVKRIISELYLVKALK
ncbi:hypothetical protein pb186bvf_017758 [Paramecium bursaria]